MQGADSKCTSIGAGVADEANFRGAQAFKINAIRRLKVIYGMFCDLLILLLVKK